MTTLPTVPNPASFNLPYSPDRPMTPRRPRHGGHPEPPPCVASAPPTPYPPLLAPLHRLPPPFSLDTTSVVKESPEPRVSFLCFAPSRPHTSTLTPPPSRSLASHPNPAVRSTLALSKSKESAASMRIPLFWSGSLHPPPPPPSVGPAEARRRPPECRRCRRTPLHHPLSAVIIASLAQ
jgi:hypothetical protein